MNGDMLWERVNLAAAELDLPVAVGGSVEPHRLIEAHRHGAFPFARHGVPPDVSGQRGIYAQHVARGLIFPFPVADESDVYALTWWNPVQRPVLPVNAGRLDWSLHEVGGNSPKWVVTCDHAFLSVVDGCRGRAGCGWITASLRSSLLALHEAGWAHSIEVWEGERLIAGLFGTGIGAVFSVDAVFDADPRAARVAFADLNRRLRGHADFIDVQVPRTCTAPLGLHSISRAQFVDAVLAIDLPPGIRTGVMAVHPSDPAPRHPG